MTRRSPLRPDPAPARPGGYGAARAIRKLAAPLLAALLLALAAALPGRAAERLVIAMLGDSLTHGYGLPPEEGLVPELGRWLAARSPVAVELVNAGVSGDTTAGGLARLDWTLTPEVGAVVVALGGNDLLRGIDPAATRANLDAILARIRARGLPVILAGLPAPGNFGPEYKAEFDAIFPELAERHGAILYPFFLEGLAAGTDPAGARDLMQPDGIHPNAEGVRRIVAHLGPVVLRMVEDWAAARAGG